MQFCDRNARAQYKDSEILNIYFKKKKRTWCYTKKQQYKIENVAERKRMILKGADATVLARGPESTELPGARC